MSNIKISIVIVNYNVRDFLINALASLYKSLRDITHEIFVVDNASIDDSVAVLKREFPSVIVFENNENLGFAKANNLALKQCKGEYILLLNPDTLVGEDTIGEMIRFFETTPEAGVAGCKILNADGTLQLACRRSYPTPWSSFAKLSGLSSFFPKSKLFGRYNLTYMDPDKTYEVEALSGSFMMFRKKVYDEIGGLDENFFMYGEDLDWFYRAYKSGRKIYYVHSTQIIHFKGESTKKSDFDAVKKFYEAMHLFVKKHYKSTSLVVPILRLGIFIRSLVAFTAKAWNKNFAKIFDIILINIAVLLSEYFRFGKFFNFPDYAYPYYYIFVTLLYLLTFSVMGIYKKFKYSISRSMFAVIVSFLVVAFFELFFKSFAFSRATLLFLFGVSILVLPGWRFLYRLFEGGRSLSLKYRQKNILGPRTLIVGYHPSTLQIIDNLRKKYREGFDNIAGIMPLNQTITEIPDYDLIRSNNLNDVISKFKIEQILFSTPALSYSDILNYVSSSENKNVIFKMIPKESDIMNETNFITGLDLVQIDLKVNNFFNKLSKRTLDIVLSLFLLLFFVPASVLNRNKQGALKSFTRSLFRILAGKISFVGITERGDFENAGICKFGLTSLAKLNLNQNSTDEEVQRLDFLYAKNQSFFLDCEILINTLIELYSKKKQQ